MKQAISILLYFFGAASLAICAWILIWISWWAGLLFSAALGIFLLSALPMIFLVHMQRCKSIEKFRVADFSYRLPLPKAPVFFAIPTIAIILLAIPIAVPTFSWIAGFSLATSLVKLYRNGWSDFLEIFSIKDAFEVIAGLFGLSAFFIYFWRILIRAVRNLRSDVYFSIDGLGVRSTSAQPWQIWWADVTAIDVVTLRGTKLLVLRGNHELDVLRERLAIGTPKRMRIPGPGFFLSNKMLGISFDDFERIVRECWLVGLCG